VQFLIAFDLALVAVAAAAAATATATAAAATAAAAASWWLLFLLQVISKKHAQ
jgi:hypothetical protein